MRWCLLLLVTLPVLGCATVPERVRPADWQAHRLCGADTRPDAETGDYCLEVIELTTRPKRVRAHALLVPGMLQNAWSFDVLPEEGISFARNLVKHGVQVWIFHVRCIGRSDCPEDSNLDDIVVDDLPRAVDFVADQAGEPIIVIGQSQGSITLQGYLAGLTREGDGVRFDTGIARERQARIHSAGLFTGSVALTGPSRRIPAASQLGLTFGGVLRLLFDDLSLGWWAARFGPGMPHDAHTIVFRPELVSDDAARALYQRTVDATTVGIGLQLAEGVAKGGIRSGEVRWLDHLENIQVPVVQTVFGLDPLSDPVGTWRDSFSRIGSPQKRLKRVRNQSHEDWMLNRAFHDQHWLTIEELIVWDPTVPKDTP